MHDSELAARLGRGEFAVLLPEADWGGARGEMRSRKRRRKTDRELLNGDGQVPQVTATSG